MCALFILLMFFNIGREFYAFEGKVFLSANLNIGISGEDVFHEGWDCPARTDRGFVWVIVFAYHAFVVREMVSDRAVFREDDTQASVVLQEVIFDW